MYKNISLSIITSCLVALLVTSCSTKKNTVVSRAYHNLTAHYNVYFNGKEAFKEGIFTVEKDYKDKYSDILPVFMYSKDGVSSAAANMDRAIQKSSKLIKTHSITVKPKMYGGQLDERQRAFYAKKDFCNWVDDAYLLMGKSWFYKQDFSQAARNFEFVVNEFKTEDIHWEAALWLARTKTETSMYEDCEDILLKLDNDPKFPEKWRGLFNATFADMYIRRNKFPEAIGHLEEAIARTKKKSLKTRYTYILAQLQQATNNMPKALELYAKVLDMNPSYAMAFNAKINMATAYQNESGNSAEMMKILKKLLKDKRNEDFQDQIYYAMANIVYQSGDLDQALKYYQLSVQKSKDNPQQKAISYLAVGQIYYGRKQYYKAQPFYDSCMLTLPETFRNYGTVKTITTNLDDYAKNYLVAYTEDSLQRMARMEPKQRMALIDKTIARIKQEQFEREQMEYQARISSAMYRDPNAVQTNGKWYFYNPSTRAAGKDEFVRRWGPRKLEDYWQRKNKAAVDASLAESDSTAERTADGKKKPKLTNTMPEYYLQNLPTNDSLMDLSQKRGYLAAFNVGHILMNRIEDDPQAIASFEQYLQNYPKSSLLPLVYYNLYQLYRRTNQNDKAEEAKQVVIKNYPTSNYAQALMNPNFVREMSYKEQKLDRQYKHALNSYLRNDYSEVLTAISQTQAEYPNNKLNPKFAFIKAMTIGKQGTVDTLKKGLQAVIDSFPKDDVAIFAKQIIEYINNNEIHDLKRDIKMPLIAGSDSAAAKSIQNEQKEEAEIYFWHDNTSHLLVMAANAETIDPKRLKFNLINYNLEFFSNFDFDISIKEFSKKYILVVVKPLVDNKQAMNYYDLIGMSPEIFDGLNKDDVQYFIIDEKNYSSMLQDKRVERYMDFFYYNYSH